MSWEIALDPSGNFAEGKGTTGIIIAKDDKVCNEEQIYAKGFSSAEEYWDAIIKCIKQTYSKSKKDLTIICEDYRLYASASDAQINSNLETPQLIGVIRYFCWQHKIPLVMQMAAEVKTRWSPEIMLKTGKLEKCGCCRLTPNGISLGHHSIDAYKHWLHYVTFKKYKDTKTIKEKRGEHCEY